MESLIKFVQDEFVTKKDFPEFSAGDTITVYYEIREGQKVRTQFFRGVVLQKRDQGLQKHLPSEKNVWNYWCRTHLPNEFTCIAKN